MKKICSIAFIFLVCVASLNAFEGDYGSNYVYDSTCECCPDTPYLPCLANSVKLSPEISYLKRKREGGTSQTGMLYGVKASFERIYRYKYYLGLQGSYATGDIKGHAGNRSTLKSCWTDERFEGNVGYTFQYKYCPYYSFTPFVGAGYFRETNKFHRSSPLPLKFITESPYISYGFLSSIIFYDTFSIGLNARFKTPWDLHCRVKNDPDYPNIKLLVGDSLLYRIEMPIIYCVPILLQRIDIGLTPFYERRSYGKKENYPFDFVKTGIDLIGLNLDILFLF